MRAPKPDWAVLREAVNQLISRNRTIFDAGGEFLSAHFAAIEKEKGLPEGGYWRRPLIGLRIPASTGVICAKPGFRSPTKEYLQTHERIDGAWSKLDTPRLHSARPGQLLLDRVEIELLVNRRVACRLAVTEDTTRCAFVWADSQRNLDNVKVVASSLFNLIDRPTTVFSAEAERCCNCGKPLSVITSRLRGIGPECIRFFAGIEQLAAKVREKYRSLDDEWWIG